MASGFPGSIDNFTDPLSNSPLTSPNHATLHADVNDAIEKIETNMGLVKVTSGALSSTSTDFVGCFTSLYTNYRIVLDSIGVSTTAAIYFRMLSNTTPATGSDYFWAMRGLDSNNISKDNSATAQTFGYTGIGIVGVANQTIGSAILDFYGPQLAQRTFTTNTATSYDVNFISRVGMNEHNLTTAYDGIRFLTNSAATMQGTVTIYGYRK